MVRARAPRFPAALLFVTAALLSTGGYAQSQTTWTFTTITESPAALASFSVPSVNDAGQVAVVVNDVALGPGVYRYEPNNAGRTTIADTAGPIASINGNPAMNASGLVTFTATMDDGSVSVLCGNGGAPVTIANTVADGLASIDSKPFISDTGGLVVVRAVRSSDGARVILTGTGAAAPATLLDSTGTYDPVDVAGINSSGVVAFEAETLAGTVTGVYRTSDGVSVTPVVTSADGFSAVEVLDINNTGRVTFSTNTLAGLGTLSVQTTGPSKVFAEAPTPFSAFGAASVAESGALAFLGDLADGPIGIFAGGTLLYEAAIRVGDGLLGSIVTVLETGPQAVTNGGRFVFRAERFNGTTGIYLATPSVSDGGGGGGGGATDWASVALLLLICQLRRRPPPGPASGRRIES